MLRRLLESLRIRGPKGPVPQRGRPAGRAEPPRRTAEAGPPPGPGAARRWAQPLTFDYAPRDDDKPDPGEVVWTWVPYEEDASVGKDRPVVVMATISPGVLGVVPLSSRAHPGDPRWFPIGSGAWDPQRRPSSVRLDLVLAVSTSAVRREGSALDRHRFDEVADALRARHGWA